MKPLLSGAAAFLGFGAAIAAAGGEGGDPDRGRVAYQKCYACHSLEPGRNDLSGPTLHQVVGRRIAAEPGFDYSDALREFARREPVWTPELLARYVADPEVLVPGTDMTFTGMKSAAERADLIAYLSRATRSEDDGEGGAER